MKIEELTENLGELNLRFEGLRENVAIFQENINNNISWFYMLLSIITAVLLVSLYFLVKNAVSVGIERGIEKTNKKIELLIKDSQQFEWAKGKISVNNQQFQLAGLSNLSKQGLLMFELTDKNGMQVRRVISVGDNGVITVDVPDIQSHTEVYWSAIWVPNKMFEDGK